jgi:hypothetical protein
MNRKIVYQTNSFGRYVGTTEAEACQLEPDVFLIPAGCVEIPPPEEPEHKAACWIDGKWQLLDFFEGVTAYNIKTGEPLTLDGFAPMPSGYTLKQPKPLQVWKNDHWADDTAAILASLHEQKKQEINQACALYTESGFVSQALGWPFHYDSALVDQINLTGSILSGLAADIACTDMEQHKAFRSHTAEQLRDVGQDLFRFKQAAQLHAENLRQVLTKAFNKQDSKAMDAIKWTPPA